MPIASTRHLVIFRNMDCAVDLFCVEFMSLHFDPVLRQFSIQLGHSAPPVFASLSVGGTQLWLRKFLVAETNLFHSATKSCGSTKVAGFLAGAFLVIETRI